MSCRPAAAGSFPEQLDPGLRTRCLTGQRRGTAILPRQIVGLASVHVDHVAGELAIVGTTVITSHPWMIPFNAG